MTPNVLTITHTHADGTLITGTAKGDGSAEALKANRWRWGRSIGCWYVPHSRDNNADQYRIRTTAEALKTAGFRVETFIDNWPRPTAEVEADKAARADDRADAMQAKAERKAKAAERADDAARSALDRLPEGGEPIKVNHHSAGRHRRDIDRAHTAIGRSVEADRAADEAQRKAAEASAATGARYAPVTVANRIKKLEAEARKIDRRMNGYTAQIGTPYQEEVPPTTGARRERLSTEADRLGDELDYWRGIRAEQIESGQATDYSRQDFNPGDYAKVRGVASSWWKIKRVNPKTVTVTSRGSEIKAPYETIVARATAAEVEAAQQKLTSKE